MGGILQVGGCATTGFCIGVYTDQCGSRVAGNKSPIGICGRKLIICNLFHYIHSCKPKPP